MNYRQRRYKKNLTSQNLLRLLCQYFIDHFHIAGIGGGGELLTPQLRLLQQCYLLDKGAGPLAFSSEYTAVYRKSRLYCI